MIGDKYEDNWVELPGIYLEEDYLNVDKDYFLCETIRTDVSHKEPTSLFRDLQRQHGRCISSVYVDRASGAVKIGWIFEKRVKYTDVDETFLMQTWTNFAAKLESERTGKTSWRRIGVDEAAEKHRLEREME